MEEGLRVKPNDTVSVTATKLARHMQPGKVYTLHVIAAKRLKDLGVVIY